jgi:hypothetical protein
MLTARRVLDELLCDAAWSALSVTIRTSTNGTRSWWRTTAGLLRCGQGVA